MNGNLTLMTLTHAEIVYVANHMRADLSFLTGQQDDAAAGLRHEAGRDSLIARGLVAPAPSGDLHHEDLIAWTGALSDLAAMVVVASRVDGPEPKVGVAVAGEHGVIELFPLAERVVRLRIMDAGEIGRSIAAWADDEMRPAPERLHHRSVAAERRRQQAASVRSSRARNHDRRNRDGNGRRIRGVGDRGVDLGSLGVDGARAWVVTPARSRRTGHPRSSSERRRRSQPADLGRIGAGTS